MSRRPSPDLEFGPFQLDRAGRRLLRQGQPVSLTPKALDTLEVLVDRPGEVVSREELMALVWPDAFVEEGILSQNIYTLRKALGGNKDTVYIETVPRRGYRFAVAVRQLAGGVSSEAGATAGSGTSSSDELGGPRSLGVLPFATLGDDEEAAILGLAMADALVTRLSRLDLLRVLPCREPGHLSDEGLALGRQLGVVGMLGGRLLVAGERLRLTVQLLQVADGSVLWAQDFDAERTDLFELQDSISERVVEGLRLRLSRSEQRDMRPARASRGAYEAYVRGRYFWSQRTEASLMKAIGYFRQAIAEEPTYAPAQAGLADCYVLLPLYGSVPPRSAFPEATAAALEALSLDEGLAEAHTSLAYARFLYEWRFAEAEASFRRALELNPLYANAHHWYAFLLSALGRHTEAVERAQEAVRLDPLSRIFHSDLAFVLYCAGDLELAAAEVAQALELEPTFAYGHFVLALVESERGRHDASIAAARRAHELEGASPTMAALLGLVLGRAGEHAEAQGIAQQLAGLEAHRYVQASRMALVHAGLGDRGEALTALEAACEERSRFVVFLRSWPVWRGLAEEPAYHRLVAKVGLPS